MELLFCDLCHEAVPQADVKGGQAQVQRDRVICVACNRAMGGEASDSDSAKGGSESRSGDSKSGDSKSGEGNFGEGNSGHGNSGQKKESGPRPKRAPLISPALGAALGLAAIVLTLVAVVALLFRIELLSRNWEDSLEGDRKRIASVEMKQMGTRDGMMARAKQVAEEAVYEELKRLEGYDRQIAELRQAMAGGIPQSSTPTTVDANAELLTLGDAMSRVTELEGQVIFLQSRVFELLKEEADAAVDETPLKERLLVPTGKVGELVTQLAHPDAIERVSALYGLAMVEDEGIVRHISPLLKDDDAYIRALSARILERLKARSAVQDLIEALGDRDVIVRESAVSALRVISAQQFAFDPRGPGSDRFAAVKRWKAWWSDNWKAFLYSEE